MATKLLAIIPGILTVLALAFILPASFGSRVILYASLLVGGAVTGFFCKQRGWLYGGLLGVVVSAGLVAALADFALPGGLSARLIGLAPTIGVPSLVATSVVFGALGGFLGEQAR